MSSKPNIPSAQDQADEQRRLEEERAHKVSQNSASINRIFDERFGPAYYGGIGQKFREYYKPQVAEQFKDASDATKMRFANIAGSSAANKTTANLYRDKLRADSDVENAAQDAMTQAKSDVEGKRAQLVGMAEAGAGLESTAALARGVAVPGPQYSPIGDLFSRYTNALSAATRLSDAGQQVSPFYQKQIDFLRGGSKGSQQIVGG